MPNVHLYFALKMIEFWGFAPFNPVTDISEVTAVSTNTAVPYFKKVHI
jgi:hypothetical protein